MNRFVNQDRSRAVALWLFFSAAMVFAMVVIGGVTRLTGSGLSITEWKPIMGAIPPLNAAEWAEAFEKYKAIPQYAQVNAGMSLGEFQGIFWWEWLHRLVGRLIGVVFAVPFLVFLLMRRMPKRLIGRCLILLALGGLQGLIGWWMVSSGLSERVDVAPERLATHLGLAFLIFAGLIWTGLEAWSGSDHSRSPRGWTWGAGLLLGAIFLQCLLGGLVAGAKAGFVYTDWPMMNGAVFPPVEWGKGAIAFRMRHPALRQERFLTGDATEDGSIEIAWYKPDGTFMDDTAWADDDLRAFGLFLSKPANGEGPDQILLICNAGGDCEVTLPEVNGIAAWKRVLDTGAADGAFVGHQAESPAMVYGASIAVFEPA